jgi:hypothetical protein
LHKYYLSIKRYEKLMPDELDIVYAFKFTPSNYEHEKDCPCDSTVFIDLDRLLTAGWKNKFYPATKTGCGHRS